MADGTMEQFHELWVWSAEELLAANEALKSNVNADVVALTQLIQSSAKSAKQIRLLGIMGRAYIKVAKNGRKYVIFKGNAGLRPNLQGTRYFAENPKISAFVVGNKSIIEDATKATKIAVIAFVAIDIIQELREDNFSLVSLGVRVTSDVLQAALAAAAGAAVGVVLTVVGVPTVIAFVVVVATGFTVGVILTEIDRKFGLTAMARARMMSYEQEMLLQLSSAERKVSSIARVIREGGKVVAEAVVVFYAVDRLWSTVAEFMKTPYRMR